MSYAGIGSRSAPEWVLEGFCSYAEYFARLGLVLRSGGADGCDTAFEKGCGIGGGRREIYLPWPGFNGNKSSLFDICSEAFDIAEKYHPRWVGLKRPVQRLHARNSQQILGRNCDDPCSFVICYTNPVSGGTVQALRIARDYGIPIFNFWNERTYSVTEIFEEVFSHIDKEEINKKFSK